MSGTILPALPLYVTITEACDMTGVSRKVVGRLWRIGAVRHHKPSEAVRIVDLSQLRQWLAAHAAKKTKRGHYRRLPIPNPDPRPGVIYAILDPRDNRIRYIGKAADHKTRWRGHRHDLLRQRHPNQYLQRWFNKLIRSGRRPKFKVVQECLPGMMDACEAEWIAKGRAEGWKLCNLSSGGEGHIHGEESKRKLSEISKAKWKDPEYRKRWQEAMERCEGWRGHRRSPEQQAEWERNREENVRRHQQNMAIHAVRVAQVEERKWLVFVPLTYQGSAFVPLTNGTYAKVDAEDWPRASRHKWSLQIKGEYRRAKRTVYVDGTYAGTELLNRFVARATEGDLVRHMNGDQLDCRKSNLLKKKYSDAS